MSEPEAWPIDAGPDAPTFPSHISTALAKAQTEMQNHISAALAKAQAEMQNPAFDTTNPHFKNRFASLAAVRNAVVPVLAKHGIAMVQSLTSTEGHVRCTTMLLHGSGQSLTFGPLALPVAKNDAQGFGSAATYARRYSLMAVAGVVGDDDDDGNAATAGKASAREPAPSIHEDVWVALGDAAKLGEQALRDEWKRLTGDTRDAIIDYHGARWETLKAIAGSKK